MSWPHELAPAHEDSILAPAHEANTLNTVVKRCMVISSHFAQEHTVLTVDKALFCNRRVKFDFEVEKKVCKPHQHRSLLRMVRITYPKSTKIRF